jgi:putative chitinase
MLIESAELLAVMPNAGKRIPAFLLPLNDAMFEFGITSGERMAAFLAQIAHESGELRYVREIASGEAYEGRADLGNTEPGDGVKYKGRGLIQCTGRANYQTISDFFGIDFVDDPELLESNEWACRSAAWFWASRKLNVLADHNDEENFKLITRRINGGLNGWADRLKYWNRARRVLGVDLSSSS